MTGTSLDGVDVAIASIQGRGLDITVRHVGMMHRPLGDLADILRVMARGTPAKPIDYMLAARQLGEVYADAVAELCDAVNVHELDCIVAHGQTIWHAPQKSLSWQLLDPWPIAQQLNVPVLYDLRQADLIAGGQGAPITPLSDWVLYRNAVRDRAIVNLGGICNMTELPASCTTNQVRGYDAGPCNLLIDGVVRRLYPDKPYDCDGILASRGNIDKTFYDQLHAHPFYHRPAPRSTGREDFDDQWLDELVVKFGQKLDADDLIASAVDAVAVDIAQCAGQMEVVLAGGGTHNHELVRRITMHCKSETHVMISDDLGIPAAGREAIGFAVLGALSQDHVPISLAQVTGADQPGCAGAWILP
jgi:anhydro-N-acetylmuramic acid kinase